MIGSYPPHPDGPAQPHSAAVWIDLLDPTAEEARLVEDVTGVTLPSRQELAEIERSSRLAFDNGRLRLSAPIIAKADTDHPALTSVGLILTRERLITVRYERLWIFDEAAKDVAAARDGLTSFGVFAILMRTFVERQADLLEDARAKLDAISHRVFREPSTAPKHQRRSNAAMREKLRTLGSLGERTSMVRESLFVVERMISFALQTAQPALTPELANTLKVAHDDIEALSLFEEHLLGKIQFLLDAVLGFINIEQNDIFKVLTIASVVGIFPTLVAGWYGMNFHNMPEYGWTYGYQFGIGVIVVSTVLPLLWFKWRGWL